MVANNVDLPIVADDEESAVGTEWHQEAIGSFAEMLREVSRRRGKEWGICEQIALTGLRLPDGQRYDPRPDVMVLSRPLPSGDVAAVPIEEVGVPLFILEVASTSTVGRDVGDKRLAYELAGVPEYLIFDTGGVLSTPVLAWTLVGGMYVPWRATGAGRWQSASLDVHIVPEPPFLGVWDRGVDRIERAPDVRMRLEELEREVARLRKIAGDTRPIEER